VFTRAIVRRPAESFFQGLTSAGLGAPDYRQALHQHQAYCAALEKCGLALTVLDPEAKYPDSTFVEDTAVLFETLPHGQAHAPIAVLTRPGAQTRLGEIESMGPVLANFCSSIFSIQAPGTLDGGDVCESDEHFFIGLSERTNEAGAQQLAEFVEGLGYTSSVLDIRRDRDVKSVPGTCPSPNGRGQGEGPDEVGITTGSASEMLHLKSGLAYVGENRLVVTEILANREEFVGYDLVQVDRDEEYAANCIRVNDHVLVAAGYPKFESRLRALGYQTISLEMSEFQKMDGGLSCLSLRF
jgi:dimethylargininase